MIDHPCYPTEPWAVREIGLDLDVLAQSESVFALANGNLGLRGNLDEGEPRGLSGTYLNGFYESYPLEFGERGYGFPEDGQAVVNVSDGKIIRLLVEDEPFDVRHGRLSSHERVLDLRTGILSREAEWRSLAGHAVRVRSRRLVSFIDRSVAAISYEVEALEGPLRIAIQSNLQANQADRPDAADPRAGTALGKVLESQLAVAHGMRVSLAHVTKRTGIALAAGMEHLVDAPGEVSTLSGAEPDLGRVTLSVALEPGQPLRLTKLLSYHWSSRQSVEWLRDQVDASLESALAQGFDGLAERQRDALDGYWERADLELDGDPEVQQALRFARFHLFQASARAEGRSMPAKGLTGPGYDGHAFWDTEGFVLPALRHTHADAAKEALRWRHSTLPLARQRAAELGMSGAAFPWRTIHGEECSGYWPAGTAAFHVNADVASAVADYVEWTEDGEFLDEAGLELLAETARLWIELGFHDDDGGFHIHGVTGPDEYSAIVDDNVYTNLMAARNMAAAAAVAERRPETARRLEIGAEETAAWRRAAESIHVPFDDRVGVHPQDADFFAHERWDFDATAADRYPLLLHYPYVELYRKQVVKQADLVLALHLCGDRFSDEQKRRAFDLYEGLTVRDSSLSASTQAIVAAEVGHLELAYDYLAEAAFMDIRDLEHNAQDGIHMASLGGAVLATVAGLGGLRNDGGGLAFRPRLPAQLQRLAFSVTWRGARVQVDIGREEASYTLVAGDELALRHWEEELSLEAGDVAARPIPPPPDLAQPSQPPGREPVMRERNRALRAAGRDEVAHGSSDPGAP